MLRIFRIIGCLLAIGITCHITPAFAVNPDEVLSDEVLETRARNLTSIIRCMKCQNQSIDDSDADIARDLRLLVRERIVKGDSDQQVLDYLVDRYGEFILLKPRFSMMNMFLWIAPLLLLIIGFIVSFRMMRKPEKTNEVEPLSVSEHEDITKILNESEVRKL